ncbi:MAG: hypothetical protein IH948_07535, partial [Bacteroidetes bacterium]|nr:hypothetical protein [Bacteroidota bacterium]
AQSWSIVNPSREYMYETNSNNVFNSYWNLCDGSDKCYLGIRVDSTGISGTNQLYYFNKILRYDTISYYGHCSGDSWLGPKAVLMKDGFTAFFNSTNDSIKIKHNCPKRLVS